MQVIALVEDHSAICRHGNEERSIDMRLVGQQQVGTWVLVFIDAAREVIDAAQAEKVQAALTAVSLAMQGDAGDAIDALFQDLIDKEPVHPFLG